MPVVAVFDTNVLLSGLLWQGSPFHCLEMARTGRVKGLTCRLILEELADVLHRKLALESDRITECLAYLLSFLSLVPITGQLLAVIGDPDDPQVASAVWPLLDFLTGVGCKLHEGSALAPASPS